MNLKEPIKATENDLFILVHNVSRSTSTIKRAIEKVKKELDPNGSATLSELSLALGSIKLIDKEIDNFYLKCYPNQTP